MTKILEAYCTVHWNDGGAKVLATHPDVPVGWDGTTGTLDLCDEHYAAAADMTLAGLLKLADAAPPSRTRSAGRRPDPGPLASTYARLGELRWFADALGRSSEYLNPAWTNGKDKRNKYRYQDSITGDYALWVAAGRPDPRQWQASQTAPPPEARD